MKRRLILKAQSPAVFDRELPVLMYHRVVREAPALSKFDIYVTRDQLERQFQSLKARGFETVTFGDLLGPNVPPKPVILTFDDGYEDNYYNLFPLLKKYGMKAVVYILGNRRHKTNYWDLDKGEPEAPLLTAAQIREMSASGLVEFGSHSLNHTRLTDLKAAGARREIEGSRKVLEKFLRKPVLSFAYPYGVHNAEIRKMTAKAGYAFGVSVDGRYSRFGGDLFEIKRIPISPALQPPVFG